MRAEYISKSLQEHRISALEAKVELLVKELAEIRYLVSKGNDMLNAMRVRA